MAPSFSTVQDPAPPPYELMQEEEVLNANNNPHTTSTSTFSEESFDHGVYLDDVTLLSESL